MTFPTTRFGEISIEPQDALTFVDGLIGMEHLRQWVLLADAENTALAWLQCLDRPDVAVAVVSPQRFVPEYQIRVSRREIEPLALADPSDAQVLAIISHTTSGIVANLKAPLLVHVEKRLGRQIIARDDHPVQYCLTPTVQLRKTA